MVQQTPDFLDDPQTQSTRHKYEQTRKGDTHDSSKGDTHTHTWSNTLSEAVNFHRLFFPHCEVMGWIVNFHPPSRISWTALRTADHEGIESFFLLNFFKVLPHKSKTVVSNFLEVTLFSKGSSKTFQKQVGSLPDSIFGQCKSTKPFLFDGAKMQFFPETRWGPHFWSTCCSLLKSFWKKIEWKALASLWVQHRELQFPRNFVVLVAKNKFYLALPPVCEDQTFATIKSGYFSTKDDPTSLHLDVQKVLGIHLNLALSFQNPNFISPGLWYLHFWE